MKKIICLMLICICVIGLVSCSDFDKDYVYDGHSLLGKWREKEYKDSYYISYEFFDNGEVVLNEYNYGIEMSSIIGKYSVETNKILIDVTNYDKTVVHYVYKFCITDKSELIVIYLDDDQMKEKEMTLVPYDIEYNEDNSKIVGKWEDTNNKGEYWTFNENYTGTISNDEVSYKMHYSIKKNKMYMAYEFVDGVKQGLVEFEYKIKDDTLTIEGSFDGKKLEYTFERK